MAARVSLHLLAPVVVFAPILISTALIAPPLIRTVRRLLDRNAGGPVQGGSLLDRGLAEMAPEGP